MVERGADPALVVQLAHELQRRIGIQPIVKVDAFNLPNESGIIYRILRIQPSSLSEISRAIRAARTMKLHIRCIGRGTSLNKVIMMNDFSVVLDLRFLSDSERIERVQVRRKDLSYVDGIKILAGVTIKEFCNYQIRNQICVPTNTEQLERTVIGSILTGSNGTITNAYRSLADYVIQMRIMDIHGEIQTFADTDFLGFHENVNNIKSVVSGLGMLGIVYDVILRYKPLISVKVDYEFRKIQDLFDNISELGDMLNNNLATQLVYIPYNSVDFNCDTGALDIDNWKCFNDEILIRRMNESQVDSESRQFINVIDEDKNCLETILRQNELVPVILRESHYNLKRALLRSQNQYFPWAIHCFPTLTSGVHDATVTLPIWNSTTMDTFLNAFRIVLEKLEFHVKNDKNYPLNAGIRIHFTSGSRITLCPGHHDRLPPTNSEEDDIFTIDKSYTKYAHIKLLSVLSSPGWPHVSFHIIDEIMRIIPDATLQWNTEWIDRPIVTERILEMEQDNLDKLKEQIEIMDRDGVFLNNHLQKIFYPHLQSYRETYKRLQNEFINSLQ